MLKFLNAMHIIMLLALINAIVFAFLQTPSRAQNYLLGMTISVLLMVIGYTIEINSATLETALMGVRIGYIGKPFSGLFACIFICDRYHYDRLLNRKLIGVLSGLSVLVSVLVMTCQQQTLYYTSISFVHDSGLFPHLVLGHGFFYYIYMALLFLYLMVDTVICVREYKRAGDRSEKRQALCVFVLIASGIFGFILFLFSVVEGYDTTILGCFIGTGCLMRLFYKYRIFDAMEVVKEYALNESENGIIVLDQKNNIVYANKLIQIIFPDYKKAGGVDCVAMLRRYKSEHQLIVHDKRYYEVVEAVISDHNRNYGCSLELHDITDNYLYSRRLEQEVENRTHDIKRIQRQVTIGFAGIVEARDDDTGGHIRRTKEIVRLIALELKNNPLYGAVITDEYIDMLEETAPLHDVGKISIPDHILLKPGRLDDNEFAVMKTHTVLGKALIEKIMRGVENDDYISMAEDIALYHHEKWDGSGYPDGLSGEQIPLCARIMAVADVYDALRSERCYKQSLTRDQACEIIVDNKNRHFDAYVVDAFIKQIDHIEEMIS